MLQEAHLSYVLALVRFDPHDLHGDVALRGGHTFQGLIVAAAPTPHEGHTGRLEDILYLIGVLLEDVYQGLDWTAIAALVDVHELHHFMGFLLSFCRGCSLGPLGMVEVQQ